MTRSSTLALTLGALLLAAPAAWGEDLTKPELHAVPAQTEEPLELVSDDLLADLRGGQTLVIGSQTMTAVTTGNILNGDYAAGDVSLTDNALANFNGVGNLLINTGAQVSLQSGMNLIINTAP